MVLIHNKKRHSCFQLVIQGHLGISRLHPKTVKRLLSRNQVHYQFVSAPYMGVHIATEGRLEKTHAQKAWRALNQQVTDRKVCSETQSSVATSVDVFACLTGSSLWYLSEKHPEEEHCTVQHWPAASTQGRRLLGAGVQGKLRCRNDQSEGWVDKGLKKPVQHGKSCWAEAAQRTAALVTTVETDGKVRERKAMAVQTEVQEAFGKTEDSRRPGNLANKTQDT